MDRYEISYFRRVQVVELHGPQFTHEHLQKVAAFKRLRSLVLSGTSITSQELTQWHKSHSGVEVRMNSAAGEMTLAAK